MTRCGVCDIPIDRRTHDGATNTACAQHVRYHHPFYVNEWVVEGGQPLQSVRLATGTRIHRLADPDTTLCRWWVMERGRKVPCYSNAPVTCPACLARGAA